MHLPDGLLVRLYFGAETLFRILSPLVNFRPCCLLRDSPTLPSRRHTVKSKLSGSAVFGVFFTLVVLALGFYFSWLGNFITQPFAVVYSLVVVVLIGAFQAIVAWSIIKSEKERLLDERITAIDNALRAAHAFKEMVDSRRIISTGELMQLERQQQEVWVILEDPIVFQDDPEFFCFDKGNIINGMTYVFFVSSAHKPSVKWLISQLTGKQLNAGDDVPRQVKVEKGTVEFVYVDPQAFFFFSPITVWNPFPKDARPRRVFWDFPVHPPSYHVEIPEKQANGIVDRLDSLYSQRS